MCVCYKGQEVSSPLQETKTYTQDTRVLLDCDYRALNVDLSEKNNFVWGLSIGSVKSVTVCIPRIEENCVSVVCMLPRMGRYIDCF